MRITEVLLDLRDGTPIRRRKWYNAYIKLNVMDEFTVHYIRTDDDILDDPYTFTPYDLFADDWEIYTGEGSE